MNATAKYLFDLNGYVVIRNVFSKLEILHANSAIDKYLSSALERTETIRNTIPGTPLAGANAYTGRIDLGRILEWGEDSKIFRSVLDHPKLV